MSKLRIKVSGCMRFHARSGDLLRHPLLPGHRHPHRMSWPGALTRAAEGTPWIPGNTT